MLDTTKLKTFYLVTKSNWGGAQTYVYNLASNLPRDQFETTVLAGGSGELFERLALKGIKTIPLEYLDRDIKLYDDLGVLKKLIRTFKAEKPDILHLNSSKIGLLGAIAGRITGIPKIIFTAHGWPFNEPRSTLWKLAIYSLSYLTTILATDTIVIHNRDFRATRFWFLARSKVVLIHSGIGESAYLSRDESRSLLSELIGKSKKFLDTKYVIGNIAELHPNKGISYALKAISLLPDNFIYIILGEGEQRAELALMVRDLQLENRVFLPGYTPSAFKFMKGFDSFLFPSVKEGLPFAILEAGLAGTPIVASDVGGIPDIIDHEVSGLLVAPKDSNRMAQLILELSNDPRLAHKLGEKLKTVVTRVFTLKLMLEKTITLYLKS